MEELLNVLVHATAVQQESNRVQQEQTNQLLFAQTNKTRGAWVDEWDEILKW